MYPQDNKGNNCNFRRHDLERNNKETRVSEFAQ